MRLNDNNILFRAQQVTLIEEYKHIQIPYQEVKQVSLHQVLLVFPAVKVNLKNGSSYKFIIFNRNHFLKIICGKSIHIIGIKNK